MRHSRSLPVLALALLAGLIAEDLAAQAWEFVPEGGPPSSARIVMVRASPAADPP